MELFVGFIQTAFTRPFIVIFILLSDLSYKPSVAFTVIFLIQVSCWATMLCDMVEFVPLVARFESMYHFTTVPFGISSLFSVVTFAKTPMLSDFENEDPFR